MIKNLLGYILLVLGLSALALYFFANAIAKDLIAYIGSYVPVVLFLYMAIGFIWMILPDKPKESDK